MQIARRPEGSRPADEQDEQDEQRATRCRGPREREAVRDFGRMGRYGMPGDSDSAMTTTDASQFHV